MTTENQSVDREHDEHECDGHEHHDDESGHVHDEHECDGHEHHADDHEEHAEAAASSA